MEQSKPNNILKELYGVIFFFFIVLFLYSKFGPSLPLNITTQEKGQPLMVEGVGTAVAAPDSAKVNLGIEESGSSLASVQSSASEKSKKLVDAIKSLGVNEKDIKTTSYQVNPQYSFNGSTQRIQGYMISISYQVTINDLERVNEILETALANGSNQASGISFELSDETKKRLIDDARKEASEEAKQKAKSLAQASGVTLGKVLSVSEYSNSGGPVPMFTKIDAAGGAELANEVDIQPGESELSVTVMISYEIR